MAPRVRYPELAGQSRPAKGGAIPEDYYVQVRYPQGRRWVTVAISEIRRDAAKLAADAYRYRLDGLGQAATGVRVLDSGGLRGEAGLATAVRAIGDIQRRSDAG